MFPKRFAVLADTKISGTSKIITERNARLCACFLSNNVYFEYHKEHGIVPQKPVANHLEVDTIAVKRKISFKQLSDLLDIPTSDIEFLNPSYKMKVIPYVTGKTNL